MRTRTVLGRVTSTAGSRERSHSLGIRSEHNEFAVNSDFLELSRKLVAMQKTILRALCLALLLAAPFAFSFEKIDEPPVSQDIAVVAESTDQEPFNRATALPTTVLDQVFWLSCPPEFDAASTCSGCYQAYAQCGGTVECYSCLELCLGRVGCFIP